jgi:hypothetical protein
MLYMGEQICHTIQHTFLCDRNVSETSMFIKVVLIKVKMPKLHDLIL